MEAKSYKAMHRAKGKMMNLTIWHRRMAHMARSRLFGRNRIGPGLVLKAFFSTFTNTNKLAMRRRIQPTFIIAFSLLFPVLVSCSQSTDPLALVNVFNGTGYSGNTYPGATVPFGAVQLSPDTDVNSASGYHYSDSTILGFSHNHLSGTGCPDFGDFLFTPTLSGMAEPLAFSHDDESACPGYYRVDFPAGITAEMTATPRTGVHRYIFKGDGTPSLQIDANHCIGWWSKALASSLEVKDDRHITGARNTIGWAQGRDSYLSAEFSVSFTKAELTAPGVLLLTFPEGTREVSVFAGLSGVSVQGAESNRIAETEGATFEDIHGKATAAWEDALDRIKVEGGPKDVFYTFFYHTFTTPNRIEDVDGSYIDMLGRIRKTPDGKSFYSTLSLWDTFRSWHPLQTILDPALAEDIIASMLDMYDCRGELPIWPLASFETGCMTGYHSVPVIADAWLNGIRGFDGEKALMAMVESSNRNDAGASQIYVAHGYLPADLKAETVTKTLEYAYDDWCIARMAESLGKEDIAKEYYRRSLSYKEIFDPGTGFMRGRKEDGSWVEPFDPLSGSKDYVEATAWQYRFFVPHDIAGYESLMGGRENLLAAFDSLFNYTPEGQKILDEGIGGQMGQYAQGNEPGHNLAWLFNFVGAPSKSQEVVRHLLKETYNAAPDGICGNEDCGQMGAWYVLASLGIYPFCPGSGEYLLSAPLFKSAEIRLGNGKSLTIKADHPEWMYISDVTLNDRKVDRNYLTYTEIMAGGVLEFKLSSKPDHGRDDLPAPYSLTNEPFVAKPAIQGDLRLFEGEATVSMSCRTEGAAIRYTLDGSEPVEGSPLYSGPFKVDGPCAIKAKAFKEGMEPSPTAFITAHKEYFSPVAGRDGLVPGCRYTYHEANFKSVSQIDGDPEEGSGVMREPSIEGALREDHFAYCFSGYIDIPEDGVWDFALKSDDGSELWIAGEKVVANDGSHGPELAEGSIPLRKGLHYYRLFYFDDEGGQELSWIWKKEGEKAFRPVPASRLYYR